jgi:hypothetical protein
MVLFIVLKALYSSLKVTPADRAVGAGFKPLLSTDQVHSVVAVTF